MADIVAIKERVKIWDIANRFFSAEMPERDGLYRSPFREDSHRSFSVFAQGERAKDHGTGESYDVIDMLTKEGGKSFREAMGILGDMACVPDDWTPPKKKVAKKRRIAPPSDDCRNELEASANWGKELWGRGKTILHQLSDRKRWDRSYVEKLISVGVVGMSPEGRIHWLFPRGVKVRSAANTSRRDFWLHGKSKENLFLEQLFNKNCGIVYLCEGETDAIAILLSGICKSGFSSVLGIPGAGVIPHDDLINYYLRNKMVIVVGDNDKAGRSFERRLYEKLASMDIECRLMSWSGSRCNDLSDFYVSHGPDDLAIMLKDQNLWETLDDGKTS